MNDHFYNFKNYACSEIDYNETMHSTPLSYVWWTAQNQNLVLMKLLSHLGVNECCYDSQKEHQQTNHK